MSPKGWVFLTFVASVAGATAGWLSTLPSLPSAAFLPKRELIVFEAEGCVYCRVYRREILPAYEKVARFGRLTIKFLDVNEIGLLEASLASPLTIVPTTVVMVDGREVGRITGYTDKTVFLHLIKALDESR